ncbi:glycosyltransferase [Fulvimarina sp. MAC3]|uniref:glycosyltransferase n=1 Tax=Fulvimarina sp. MAC3 TaxID=3148887 RepID=UPI0031FD0357
MAFYFERFEDRRPPEPLQHDERRQLLFQYLIVFCLVLGASYLWWRWTASLNYDALWFSVPVALAETCAYFGLVLFAYNLWSVDDFEITEGPATIGECTAEADDPDRQVSVDVLFATYNEDPELVRLGIRDAKAMRYPHPIELNIYVLDDGKRPEMEAVCVEEGIGYITRRTNEGFKAGNLRNAMDHTSGDFLVICDADTRPFPTMLERTLGYFKDPKVAWVQTPQWFYDLPAGERLDVVLEKPLGKAGAVFGRAVQKVFGEIRVGEDPFVNDPQIFYDVILRRRNRHNASFCCGAGSIHRREAVMEAALRAFGSQIDAAVDRAECEVTVESRERDISPDLMEAIRSEAAISEAVTPYKFHVSEDIYTSIVLHSDRERGWKSVLHPHVESKMLSPQDLLTWTIQRFKYAGGSLDILFNDNPITRSKMTIGQKLLYASTFWSYLGGIWNTIFLLAPIVYLFTAIAPVDAYTGEFFLKILPFLVSMELAMMIGMWGVAGYKSKASYIAFFAINLKALSAVVTGKKISFPVTPKDRQGGRHLRLVWPHLTITAFTLVGILFACLALALGSEAYTLGGVIANGFWGLNNILALSGIVYAALWQPDAEYGELA